MNRKELVAFMMILKTLWFPWFLQTYFQLEVYTARAW